MFIKKNVNWLYVCADYLRQDHRGDKFAQNFFEIMANKQTIEREKTFACKKSFYDHIYILSTSLIILIVCNFFILDL